MFRVLTLALVVVFISSSYASESGAVRSNAHGIGLDGYSPVSYFTENTAEKGNPAFSFEHAGITYNFTSNEQVELFKQNPDGYLPAHGGWCTLMMGGSGRRTPGHPEQFAIVDDRLMLFWSGDDEQTRGLGLTNWGRKTHGDPEQQRDYVAKADKKWQSFLRGKRKSPILLYKPSDAEAINAGQLEQARVEYKQ